MCELISRKAAIDAVNGLPDCPNGYSDTYDKAHIVAVLEDVPYAQQCDTCRYADLEWDEEPCDSCTRGGETNHYKPSVQPQRWIPVMEALPEDLEAVNITWVNHEPEPYYHDIKDKNFVATGIHYRDKWYWYSTTCADFLGEYGSNEVEEVDDAVEIIAWMPLPEPMRETE